MKPTEQQIKNLLDGGEEIINGFTVSLKTLMDYFSKPWSDDPSSGIVSDSIQKHLPFGAVNLSRFGDTIRYYDYEKTLLRAKGQCWGIPPQDAVGLSADEIAEEAVKRDLKRIRDWFNNKWRYEVLVVEVYHDGKCYAKLSLSGVESDIGREKTAAGLVSECLNEATNEIKCDYAKLKAFVENLS